MSDVGELLCDIVEVFAESLGWCTERCRHGGICVLAADHEGAHETQGTSGDVLCSWEPTDV